MHKGYNSRFTIINDYLIIQRTMEVQREKPLLLVKVPKNGIKSKKWGGTV